MRKLIMVIMFFVAVANQAALANTEIGVQSKEDLKAYLETFREARTLLDPKEYRLSASFAYQSSAKRDLFSERISKMGSLNLAIGYGISDRFNIYGNIGELNQNSSLKFNDGDYRELSSKKHSYGVGVKYAFLLEDQNTPEMVVNVFWQEDIGKEDRFKTINLSLSVIKSFDPIVLLGSVGSEYNLDNKKSNINLTGGLAFAINDRIALGSSLSWSTPWSGEFSSTGDIAILNNRLTITAGKNIIEPSIGIGLTDFSPDMILSLTYSRRFN